MCENISVTEKLSRGMKIPINNLTGTEIEIDQGRRGLTWFETDAYTDVTLTRIERKTHATKEKKYCYIHITFSGYNDESLNIQSISNFLPRLAIWGGFLVSVDKWLNLGFLSFWFRFSGRKRVTFLVCRVLYL